MILADGGGNRDHAIARRGIDSIPDKVKQHLAQTSLRQAHDQRALLRQLYGDPYPLLVTALLQQGNDVTDSFLDWELARYLLFRPVQVIHLPNDAGDAVDLFLDEADVLVIGVTGWNGVFDQQKGVLNAGQRVVDLVSDTGGQTASSGQLLAPSQLLFHRLALGDVQSPAPIIEPRLCIPERPSV